MSEKIETIYIRNAIDSIRERLDILESNWKREIGPLQNIDSNESCSTTNCYCKAAEKDKQDADIT